MTNYKQVRLPAIFAVLSFTLLLFACGTTAGTIKAPGKDASEINGTWELVDLPGATADGSFATLFPDKKPTVKLTAADNRITGHSGCNAFSGPFRHTEGRLDFSQPFASTKMACGTNGETVFFTTLQKVNGYRLVTNKRLELLEGTTPILRFKLQ